MYISPVSGDRIIITSNGELAFKNILFNYIDNEQREHMSHYIIWYNYNFSLSIVCTYQSKSIFIFIYVTQCLRIVWLSGTLCLLLLYQLAVSDNSL